MADDKRIGVRGEWVDGVSGPYQKTADKVTAASAKMAKQTGRFVDEKMGRSLSGFNEKTEKGRQLMTAFGGSLGAAGGQATYMAGTISYVIGRFSIMELGIMALIGGLVALGVAIFGTSEETEKWRKKLVEANDALNDLESDTRNWLLQQKQMIEGWTEYEKKIHDVRAEHEEYKRMYEKALGLIEKHKEGQRAVNQLTGEWVEDIPEKLVLMYDIAGRGMARTSRVMTQLRQAEFENMHKAMDDAIKKQQESEKKGGGGGRGKGPRASTLDADLERMLSEFDAEFAQWSAARENAFSQANALEQQYHTQSNAMWEENAERKEKVQRGLDAFLDQQARKEFRRQQKLAQQQNAVIENSISLFGELGQLAAQNAQQATAARIAAIILEAGYRVVLQMAEGFAALGAAQPWLAAQHFTSAGLYAALAAGNVAQTASGGGSGGMGGGSRQAVRDYGGREEPEEKQTTIIVELGGREVGRAIMDATRKAEQERNPGATRSRLSD